MAIKPTPSTKNDGAKLTDVIPASNGARASADAALKAKFMRSNADSYGLAQGRAASWDVTKPATTLRPTTHFSMLEVNKPHGSPQAPHRTLDGYVSIMTCGMMPPPGETCGISGRSESVNLGSPESWASPPKALVIGGKRFPVDPSGRVAAEELGLNWGNTPATVVLENGDEVPVLIDVRVNIPS